MIISSQGFGHFTEGLNNQDFGMQTPKMILVLDGCSSGKFSEIGTRLFTQMLTKRKDFDNVEKFEDNVKEVFDDIISMMKKYYDNAEELENDFIMENLLFTIIACFETEDKFIVKLFGDGYIVTQNKQGRISYLRFSYGKCPPYFAYKYCASAGALQRYKFKTFEFNKKTFERVGIASDGILPFVKGEVKGIDNLLAKGNEVVVESAIKNQRSIFFDDVTIGIF